jgi:transcription elongation factor Elf1
VLPTEKIVATAPHVKDQRGSQGIIICGRCGQRMTVRYHETKGGKRLYPEYLCQKEQIEQADNKFCRASCMGQGWMWPSLICCWLN